MRLDLHTWMEVEAYLKEKDQIIIPTGSNEQHGPIGLIGTDALCAEAISRRAGEKAGILVAPTLAYTPAPFNLHFSGTISISEDCFKAVLCEIVESLYAQGFRRFYFLNGHGANLSVLDKVKQLKQPLEGFRMRVRSWWEFEEVNKLRTDLYADWEGMHATPSEIAITQAEYRTVHHPAALQPPKQLTPEFMRSHAGDHHGPPDQHKLDFPDGRVGSHSALARPEHGKQLLALAADAVFKDLTSWN